MIYFLTVLTGLVAGWLSALLGIGGGVVLIPILVYFFHLPIHQAVGTSLAVILPTALVGAYQHHRLGHVNLEVAILIALGAVCGAYAGALTSSILPGTLLRKLFALVLLGTAIHLWLNS
ncbi:MAG: sulfite exporter TauE/SafE family protein [Firmicutes bacterium]|nr:sulfite exporter TauE/SafE family protein [Bacillota bacterium]